MEKVVEFEFNGHNATVIIPKNANGKWIWKTEFLYAFDDAERALLKDGYTRVYYSISDMYGSDRAVRLMHLFHLYLIKNYNLDKKCFLFGFSRGGLYAFNYSLYYPEYVEKIYLDAPVLNLLSWPTKDIVEYKQFIQEYGLNEDSYLSFRNSPIDNLKEFFSNNIPLLLVAGCLDDTVPLSENSQILIDYCNKNNIKIEYYLKKDCNHHPHSLLDVSPIVNFIKNK